MTDPARRRRQRRAGKALIVSGLALGIFGLLFRSAFLGISFLMLFLSAVGFFLLLYGLLLLPAPTKKGCRRRRTARQMLAALLALGLVLFTAVEVRIALSSEGDGEASARQTLIVLGAGLYGETPSASLVSRLEAALALLQGDPSRIAVLSGGQGPGETITEAAAMARWLTARGIDADRLILEERATNTEQNLRYSKELLEARTEERPLRVTVVSNDFHLYRAGRLAGRLGMEATTFSAPTPDIGLVPLSCRVREFFSVIAMFVRYG